MPICGQLTKLWVIWAGWAWIGRTANRARVGTIARSGSSGRYAVRSLIVEYVLIGTPSSRTLVLIMDMPRSSSP